MRCPFCNHSETSVKDSRTTDDNSVIRRRRVCGQCGSRFTTFERVQLRELYVRKKTGELAPFDREKLTRSITTAFHKNAIESEALERIVSSIVRQLETKGDGEISTQQIGALVMEALSTVDPVAYIRFASIYHDFSNIEEFSDFIRKVETGDDAPPSKNQLALQL